MKKVKIIVPILYLLVIVLASTLLTSCSDEISFCTVHFDDGGGSNLGTLVVQKGSKLVRPLHPTREGYEFTGWWYNGNDYLAEWNFDHDTVYSDLILYAKWIAKDFTVVFESQGGSSPSPANKVVSFEQKYGVLATTIREGYTFDGWWTEPNGKGTRVESTTEVPLSSNQTLYAKWLPQYLVTFDSQCGSFPNPASKVVTYSQKYGELATTTREGYTFDGWWTEPNGKGTRVESTTEVSIISDQILYAKWKKHSYSITYDGNGHDEGTPPPSQAKIHEIHLQLAQKPQDLLRNGYSFSSWNTKADGSGTDYWPGSLYTIDADIILYAKWNINSYFISYHGNGNDKGEAPPYQTKTHGIDLKLAQKPPDLFRSGYYFSSWNTKEDGSGVSAGSEITT